MKPICRHDWHQTGTTVCISIYAKKYDPVSSTVKLNPIRAKIELIFPEDGNKFEMDIELRGVNKNYNLTFFCLTNLQVIDVTKSKVQMLASKVEIELKKAEPGAWSDLSFPKPAPVNPEPVKQVPLTTYDDEPVDLSDIN